VFGEEDTVLTHLSIWPVVVAFESVTQELREIPWTDYLCIYGLTAIWAMDIRLVLIDAPPKEVALLQPVMAER
jgi:hypothetical protein